MIRTVLLKVFLFTISIFCLSGLFITASAQSQERTLTIHLRGVYDSKISLLALSENKTFKPIGEIPGIKNGESVSVSIPQEKVPGEFVLRFDYREKETSSPYPSEKNFVVNDQDLELWVQPLFCSNPDSSYFQPGEKENKSYEKFMSENVLKRDKLGLLQNLLMNYDDTGSDLYKMAAREYEQRREAYNNWIKQKARQDNHLFVSTLYCFQLITEISWNGTETDRINDLIRNYFEGMDWDDQRLVRTSEINKYMDNYVNLYARMAVTPALRDSLLPLAGRTAIEKAKKGDPLVYGWMVDYFYRGYEANAIPAGTKILEPYMNDPKCLTSKRQEIARRLKGIETLVPGSKAPEITLKDQDGRLFELTAYHSPCKYILIFFWSGGCEHCVETADKLFPWQQREDIRSKIEVVAISVDETETEVSAWLKKKESLKAWMHFRAPEGMRSRVASDYFILSTPVMVLIENESKEIAALPNTLKELMTAVK